VPTSTELREIAFRHGQAKKRNNAIVAVLSGALPGVILTFYLPSNWERWLLGLVIGLLWGNAFEYAYHRWLLHRPRSPLGKDISSTMRMSALPKSPNMCRLASLRCT